MINDQHKSGAVEKADGLGISPNGAGHSANDVKNEPDGGHAPVQILCPKCGSEKVRKQGKRRGRQRYYCKPCNYGWDVKETITMSEGEPKAEPELSGNAGYVSLDSICKKFDVKSAILREIKKIPKGQFVPEYEFRQRTAGKDGARFRRCLDQNPKELSSYRIKVKLDDDASDGTWLWGRAEDVSEAVSMRDR